MQNVHFAKSAHFYAVAEVSRNLSSELVLVPQLMLYWNKQEKHILKFCKKRCKKNEKRRIGVFWKALKIWIRIFESGIITAYWEMFRTNLKSRAIHSKILNWIEWLLNYAFKIEILWWKYWIGSKKWFLWNSTRCVILQKKLTPYHSQ